MLMSEQLKELVKTLLKNHLITVREVAMLKANRKEDRDELISLVQRLYEDREPQRGDVEVISISEEDVLMLLDYITSEPITVAPVTIVPEFPGVRTIPNPYFPGNTNVPYTDPYPYYPNRPDVVYCQNKTSVA